ncbi:hypothetical protein I3760_13G104600 [Carya illinoinensis]|nr:hypothetical protein I3760_13G104600 [Carya illinoinensis]
MCTEKVDTLLKFIVCKAKFLLGLENLHHHMLLMCKRKPGAHTRDVNQVHGLSKEQLAARIHRLLTSFNIREFFVLDRCDPVMTAYKLVTIDAPYWGFGRRLEQALLAGERALFLESHRHCFGWIDEWYGMTVQQIDELLQPNDSTLNERIVKPALMMSIEYFSGESPPDGEGIYSKKSQSVS